MRLLRWLTLVAAFASTPAVGATICDAPTRAAIEDLLTRREANRARINNLRITASFEASLQTPTKKYLMSRERLTYYENGTLQRVDQFYEWNRDENGKPYGLEGQIQRFAQDGAYFYSYWVGTDLAGASTNLRFHFYCDYSYIDDPRRAVGFPSHEHTIRESLNRPRRIDVTRMWRVYEDAGLKVIEMHLVSDDDKADDALMRWFFDPAKGYEIVRSTDLQHYEHGKLLHEIKAQFEAREVVPGVWRAVAGERIEHGDEGNTHTLKIYNVTATANGDPIPPEMFTLAGMGAPKHRVEVALAEAQRNRERREKIDALRGKVAPAFPAGAKWLNTEPQTWEKLRGKIVVLYFFDEADGQCVPDMAKLNAAHAGGVAPPGVAIVAVHRFGTKQALVERRIKPIKAKMPVMLDIEENPPGPEWGQMFKDFRIDIVPKAFVIDRDGVIVGDGSLFEALRIASERAARS